MLEIVIEEHLCKEVQRIGGSALKSEGITRGFPDRIVLLPDGRTIFVEVKKPTEKPRKQQQLMINFLKGLNHDVRVIDTKEGVDAFIKEVSA